MSFYNMKFAFSLLRKMFFWTTFVDAKPVFADSSSYKPHFCGLHVVCHRLVCLLESHKSLEALCQNNSFVVSVLTVSNAKVCFLTTVLLICSFMLCPNRDVAPHGDPETLPGPPFGSENVALLPADLWVRSSF